MIGPFATMVLTRIPTGRTEQAAGMLTVTQGDAVVVHVHGRGVPFAVWFDFYLQRLPALAVILALIDGQIGRGVMLLHKGKDLTVALVHRHASAHEAFTYGDFGTPSIAAVFAPLNDDPVPNGEDRTIDRYHHVGKAVAVDDLLQVDLRFADKCFELPLGRMTGCRLS